MKPCLLLLLIVPLLIHSIHFNKISPKNDEQHWVQLFNGKNLEHWIPKIAGYKAGNNFGNTFRVENSLLSTRYNNYDSFNKRFGALYFNKKFTNFKLRVEYWFVGTTAPGGPSWGYKDGAFSTIARRPRAWV